MYKISKLLLFTLSTLLLGIYSSTGVASSASCSVNNPVGSIDYKVKIPQAGDYKFWVRLRPESKTANKVYLEIDGNTCFAVGGDDSLGLQAWNWVDRVGKVSDKKSLLHKFESGGEHTFKVNTDQSGVGVDRILLLAATDTCIPSNTQSGDTLPGDNCKTETTVTPVENTLDTSLPLSLENTATSAKKSRTPFFIVGIILAIAVIGLLIRYKKFDWKKLLFWKKKVNLDKPS